MSQCPLESFYLQLYKFLILREKIFKFLANYGQVVKIIILANPIYYLFYFMNIQSFSFKSMLIIKSVNGFNGI